MSLSLDGRLTAAEAELLDNSEITLASAPLYLTTITIVQPAKGVKHARELTEYFLENAYYQLGRKLELVEVTISEPKAL